MGRRKKVLGNEFEWIEMNSNEMNEKQVNFDEWVDEWMIGMVSRKTITNKTASNHNPQLGRIALG